MKTFRNAIALSFMAVFVVGCASTTSRPASPPAQQLAVSTSPLPCPDSLERFLPGEYYFCAAAQDYEKGRMNSTVQMLGYSAQWANKSAQYALGIMYYNGDHIAANRPLGIAWLALAAERHDPRYEAVFVSAYRSATAQERADANTLWLQLKPVYADKVAAVRAVQRNDRELSPVYRSLATNGGSIYLAGLNIGSSELAFEQLVRMNRDTALRDVDGTVTVGDAPMVQLGSLVGPPPTDR